MTGVSPNPTGTPPIGSLFSGYGGLDLAVEAVTGGVTVWHSEIEAAPSRVLAARWPGVPNLGDVTAVDWSTVQPVDVLAGGFPCQDVSHAGKRAGMRAGTRSGLWARMVDAIEALRPALVVAENVRGLLSAEADSALEPCPGCVGDPDDGAVLRALGRVLADLAELGYDARWCGLRAADVGAPHGRFRVFILASDAAFESGGVRNRDDVRPGSGALGRRSAARTGAAPDTGSQHGEQRRITAPGQAQSGWALGELAGRGRTPAPDTDDTGLEGRGLRGRGRPGQRPTGEGSCAGTPTDADSDALRVESISERRGSRQAEPGHAVQWGQYEPAIRRWEQTLGRVAPPPTELAPKGGQRLSPRFVEFMMGLPAGWVTDVPGISRNEQLKMLGNGVVPQQAAAALLRLVQVDQFQGAELQPGLLLDGVGVGGPVAGDQFSADSGERVTDSGFNVGGGTVRGGGGENSERCHVVDDPSRPHEVNKPAQRVSPERVVA